MNAYYQPYWTNNKNELEHFGIKGMKWGIRRYQNADGTLTEAGKKRYGSAENFEAARERSKARRQTALKVAKTGAKAAAIVGLGMLSTRMMDVAVSNILNTPDPARARLMKAALDTYGTKSVASIDPNKLIQIQKTKANQMIDYINYQKKQGMQLK